MLEGLDEVPWSNLGHAHGTAENVPRLIRSLADCDPQRADEALAELFQNIWHQGTVYDGDARKQFEAIWQYLLAGREIKPPAE